MSIETPVLPGIEWPEPVMTADLIIKQELEETIRQQEFFILAIRNNMQYDIKDPSPAAQISRYRRSMHLAAYVGSAGNTALMVQIQQLAPGLADQLLRDWHEQREAGDTLSEWVWEWATERGMDPEEIKATAEKEWKEKHGD